MVFLPRIVRSRNGRKLSPKFEHQAKWTELES